LTRGATCTIPPVLHAMSWDRPLARPAAAVSAHVSVARRCYAVGQKVAISGRGFAASAPYDLSIDGVDFGQSLTNAQGGFRASVLPGGLAAGQTQIADQLTATDGVRRVSTTFTVTRSTGALFGSGSGGAPERHVPFQVWDFAPTGPAVDVYLHYLSPAGRATSTVRLGVTRGQCGALSTPPRALFPFVPARGTWTLQFDTSRAYRAKPAGRSTRLRVAIS
jgi:hypothetical protein